MFNLKLVFFLLIINSTAYSQQRIADSLKGVLATQGPDTNRANTFRMLAGALAKVNTPEAIKYGMEGIRLGKQLKFPKGIAGSYLNVGSCYINLYKLDSAKSFLDSALIYGKIAGDDNRLALIYLNIADIYVSLGNLNQSLVYADSSLQFAEKANNDDRKARVYQTLGSVYYKQNKYDESTRYYERAIRLYEKAGKRDMVAIVYNNLGNIYKNKNDFETGIKYFRKAIEISDSSGIRSSLPLFYNNMSDAYLEKGDLVAATVCAKEAMNYAVEFDNMYQISIAHSHFAEISMMQNKFSEAIESAQKAYKIAQDEGLMDWQQTAADLLAEAYSRSGNSTKAYEYLQISKDLNDSLITTKFNEDIAALQTSFKVEEKDKEILILNKETALRESEIRQQRTLIILAFSVALLAIVAIVFLVNRNRLKQRMKELELRNRIAADLHDEVGSSLSSIHVLSHMASKSVNGSAEGTFFKISANAKETMDRMSDIVWAIHPGNDTLEQLVVRMKEFAADILDPLDIAYSFNIASDPEHIKLNINQRRDLFLIFKEGINNAVKYSKCKNVDIRFCREGSKLLLEIKDDGNGFDLKNYKAGNGLNNMHQRAIHAGGKLHIQTSPGSGCSILFSISE